MESVKLQEYCRQEYENIVTTPASTNPKTVNGNNGRWTREEHTMFIDALQLYGKNWRKVEEHIGTRTGAQIRSHAQKFFIRIEKESSKKKDKDKTTSSEGPTSAIKSSHADNHKKDLSSDSESKIEPHKEIPIPVQLPEHRDLNGSFANVQMPNYQSYTPQRVIEKKESEKKINQAQEVREQKQPEVPKYDNTTTNKIEDNVSKLIPDDAYKMDFIEDHYLLQN